MNVITFVDIDADAARSEEENQMLEDANKWLNNKSVKEKRHQRTGATALHVAAAKGYMKVIWYIYFMKRKF